MKTWPTLTLLCENGELPYEAYALAELYTTHEAEATLICHLLLAAQQGHLCVKIEGSTILPAPEEIWTTENATIFNHLKNLVIQASQKPLCEIIHTQASFYYLKKYWELESQWIGSVKKLLQPTSGIIFDQNLIHAKLELLLSSKKLLPEQAQAIQQASQQGLSLICGGPGTGKTYTAGILIKTLWEQLSTEQQASFQIALAAPTGKAAANLQNSLAKATADLPNWQAPKAKTLHALLEINASTTQKKKTFSPLAADLILVDESSMIDSKMMIALFEKIKPGARLILLGDPHQLPAVGMGSPFSELKNSPVLKPQISELSTCLRAELKGILDLADLIKKGETKQLLELAKQPPEGIICQFFDESKSTRKIQENFVNQALDLFAPKNTHHPEELFNLYNQFRILSPLRKGPFGIETLNQIFLQEFLKIGSEDTPFTAPILLTKNDYQLELFNGEIGILVKKHRKEGLWPGDYALFPSKSDFHSFRQIPALLLPHFEYAYCLSVHKSQGSEFEQVLLVLPSGAEVFGREIFYTAVTRSKKRLQIWTNEQTLVQTIQRSSQRLSGFSERI